VRRAEVATEAVLDPCLNPQHGVEENVDQITRPSSAIPNTVDKIVTLLNGRPGLIAQRSVAVVLTFVPEIFLPNESMAHSLVATSAHH